MSDVAKAGIQAKTDMQVQNSTGRKQTKRVTHVPADCFDGTLDG